METRKELLKSDLPKSFGICFKFMIFFAISSIVLFVLSHSIKGLSENYHFILQLLPFIFMAVASMFSIVIAWILVVTYINKPKN